MAVYRGFDQETLDREYRARGTVPVDVFEEAIARYASDSARAREVLECRADIRYGDTADEVVDIFPAGAGAPVLFYIHGGYWRMLSQKESAFMAECFTGLGVAVVTVNYSLAPAASLDTIVAQCRRALAWTYKNAASFGGDPEKIFVTGSSAGGHLTGAMISGGWHGDFGVPANIVNGACAISGIFDLEPIRLCEVNEWAQLDAASARRNSPIHHIPEAGCPLIVSYGGNETAEFKRQTDDYADAWRARGFAATYIDMSEANHFDIVFDYRNPDGRLTRAVRAAMGL